MRIIHRTGSSISKGNVERSCERVVGEEGLILAEKNLRSCTNFEKEKAGLERWLSSYKNF